MGFTKTLLLSLKLTRVFLFLLSLGICYVYVLLPIKSPLLGIWRYHHALFVSYMSWT